MLRNTDAEWILMTSDGRFFRVRRLEEYLRNTLNPTNNIVVGGTEENVKTTESGNWTEHTVYQEKHLLGPFVAVGYVVSRSTSKYIVQVDILGSIFDFRENVESILKRMKETQLTQSIQWKTSEFMIKNGNCDDNSNLVI